MILAKKLSTIRPDSSSASANEAIWMWLAISVLSAAISFPAASARAELLIAKGSTWAYLDDGSDQGTMWRQPGFEDSSWPQGSAQLGYGDGDESTVLSYGPDPDKKFITTYFRHTFTVFDPEAYGSLGFKLLRDDGAVVFVNGTEVFRSNMQGGHVDAATPAASAIGGSGEDVFHNLTSDAALLVTGPNIVAVEIHQANGTSSDISFDLELQGQPDSARPRLVRGPYLQSATATSIVVRWRTDFATDSRVRYGTNPDRLDQWVDNASYTTEHEVRLDGLSADARYHYAIGTSEIILAGGDGTTLFETAPWPGDARPTRIWVIGDSGTANDSARAVRDGFLSYSSTVPIDLWLMLGDNAYRDGTDTEYQTAVFDMYPSLLRRAPVWPTLGNHDGVTADSITQSGPYFEIFALPQGGEAGGVASGTEAYYAFDHGNIHFIVLDSQESDRSPNGAMLTWLEADLQASRADWIIAAWHHPPYSKGSHDSDRELKLIEMRENALPLLESYGVDLVLTGHSHSYERSLLLDGHYGSSDTLHPSMILDSGDGRLDGDGAYVKSLAAPHDGAVYVVAGSSGKVSSGALDHPAMFVSLAELGSVVLDVDRLRLDATFLNAAGEVADHFTLLKGNETISAITGLAWRDLDQDGKRTDTEPRLAGVSAELLDTAGLPVTGVTTDTAGEYRFSGLEPGIYSVRFTFPSLALTLADQGLNDAIDSDADPNSRTTVAISLALGRTFNNVDAGWVEELLACVPSGAWCSRDDECCSGWCRGKRGAKRCR